MGELLGWARRTQLCDNDIISVRFTESQERDHLDCPKCGAEVPEGQAYCGKCGEPMANGPKLEDLDLIRRFRVGDMVASGFNIIAKFIDDLLKSVNSQLISPYIKYRSRMVAMILSVVVLTVVASAILAYLDVITGEAFVFVVGIILGFILASLGKVMG